MLSKEHISKEISDLLIPGNIFYLYFDFLNSKSKLKYLVLVGLHGKAHFFIINTNISNFIMARDELLKCQVGILKEDYDFLENNSYINCTKIKPIGVHVIIDQIKCYEKAKVVGKLITDDINKVLHAIDEAETLSNDEKEKLKKFLTEPSRERSWT